MLSNQRMGWWQAGQRERGATMLSPPGQPRDADVEEAAEEKTEEEGRELQRDRGHAVSIRRSRHAGGPLREERFRRCEGTG